MKNLLFLFLFSVSCICYSSCNLSTDGNQTTIDPDSVMLRKPESNISIKTLMGNWYSSYQNTNLSITFGGTGNFETAYNGNTESHGQWKIIEGDSLQFSQIANNEGTVAPNQTFKIRAVSDSVLVMQSHGSNANQIYFKGELDNVVAQDYFNGDIKSDEPKFLMFTVQPNCKVHIAIAGNRNGVSFQVLHTDDTVAGDDATDWVGTLEAGDYKIKITAANNTQFDLAVSQTRE